MNLIFGNPNLNEKCDDVDFSLEKSSGWNDRRTKENNSQDNEIRASARNAALVFANRQLPRENIDLLSEEVK